MASNDDDLGFAFDDEQKTRRQSVKRPGCIFFHYFFRTLAVLVYIFCGWFSNSFIANFISVIFLHAMDFWVVKNITGRLLVGLRWWNKVEDDGTSKWLFESKKDRSKILAVHSRLFWIGLFIFPVFWLLVSVVSLFKLSWGYMTLCIVGMIMTGSNAYGYILCKKDASKSITTIASEFLGQQAMKQVMKNANT
jgi:hypothetical protein